MQGQIYRMQGTKRWGCDGDLVCIASILYHVQPSQLTDYSPRCGTTSYSRNVSIPMYFDTPKISQPNLASYCESIQERWKAIKKNDRDNKEFGESDEDEMRFFKYIHVLDSLVWTKARTINDIPAQVLTASALLQGFERTRVWGEDEVLKKLLTEDLIRFGSGLNLQQIHVLRASNCVPEHVIAAWLSQSRFKPDPVTFLDLDQQVRLRKKI